MLTRKMYCDCSKARENSVFVGRAFREIIDDNVRWLEQEGILAQWARDENITKRTIHVQR
jgi:hypothetical protein